MYELLSFDVYGTLINTPTTNTRVFRSILEAAKAPHVDVEAFCEFWERRNISHYVEPYRSYKQICELSLQEAFERFGIPNGDPALIGHYFSAFSEMELYPDVLPTLKALKDKYRIAVVSNIDDDLFRATQLRIDFDLVCTAERAGGYKPDGTLFRYLLAHAGLPTQKILHSGQSQFTDFVGAKPLGLTVAWINRRSLTLSPDVPRPDHVLPDVASLRRILD
jgi:2-haloacid dehalogenase